MGCNLCISLGFFSGAVWFVVVVVSVYNSVNFIVFIVVQPSSL